MTLALVEMLLGTDNYVHRNIKPSFHKIYKREFTFNKTAQLRMITDIQYKVFENFNLLFINI